MSPIAPVLDRLGEEVAALTARLGRQVDPAALGVSDRTGLLQLDEPGLVSANRACHLVRAADGWIAANLAREDDQELVPAWLGCEPEPDHWSAIERAAKTRGGAELIETAILLGIPACRVGEISHPHLDQPRLRMEAIEPVGNYALRIVWNDGHSTGIYSYSHLRSVCPCAPCRLARAQQ